MNLVTCKNVSIRIDVLHMLSQHLHVKLYKLRTSICASNSLVILLIGITDLFD